MRHAPEDECKAYTIVADYLEEMIKENRGKRVSSIDNEWTREIIAQNLLKTVEKYGVTTESANDAATLIQVIVHRNKSISIII